MLSRIRLLSVLAATVVIAVGVAACGDDDSDSDTSGQAVATNAASSTVSVESMGGNDVLVDAQGAALYTNDRDTGSKIACTGECASIWIPVELSGGQPSADDASLQAKLGVITRSDGAKQVTFDGKPLYSFAEDMPGEVTGDGFSDSFGGTDFVWSVATPTGAATGATGAQTQTDTSEDDDSGGGGYGY
jgi:predicted lipoprotein with Yx(FWY)xxD motif